MSKKLSIRPLGDKILLDVEQADLGNIDSSSVKTGVEWAVVLDTGPEVKTVKKGDRVFVKGWSVDTILYEGKDYYFTSESLKGLCAVVD